jgi:hypothetical protein
MQVNMEVSRRILCCGSCTLDSPLVAFDATGPIDRPLDLKRAEVRNLNHAKARAICLRDVLPGPSCTDGAFYRSANEEALCRAEIGRQ